ncbi:glycosyltransferase [uncultured Williamsia sp.]|uniref:glycosyltransferase family 4 protein n=1 Tax=uncultured Williamsia sp. TaxID=259311 RepID=UPI002625EEAE|nr:glycosyltransferase [uncultured Williamsia sp.]
MGRSVVPGPRVLWASTSTSTRGGVASTVSAVLSTELSDHWRIRHVTTHRDGSDAVKIATFLLGALRFVGELVVRRPSIVHLHTASYGSFARKAVLAIVARVLRMPVVLHVHGAEFHLFAARLPRPARWVLVRILTDAAAVVALGPGWARRLSAIAPDARVVVIPNAVRGRTPSARPADGPTRVVFLGRVGDRKGAFDLIRAWAASPTARGSHLTIAGDGEVDRARALVADLGVEDSVDVCGWVGADTVDDLLRRSEVLVLPSHDEGQPMAVLEAMAAGLCVVATPVGGVPDLLDDSCSVLVAPGDVDGLRCALDDVLGDDDRRGRLAAAAHLRFRTDFDVDTVWRRVDALYREITDRPAPHRPLRVMHVVPDLRIGGAERHVATLMPALDRERFAPSVVCIGEPGALFDELVGVPAVALRRSRRDAPRALWDLVRHMRTERPDIVLTRGYNADVLGRLAAILAGVPHRAVWIHHVADVDDRPRLRRVVDRLLDGRTDRYLGVAYAQTSFLTETLGHPADKVVVVRNGVEVDAFTDLSSVARTPIAVPGVDGTGPVMGTVSAMRPEKDHETFLRAAAAVAVDVPELRVLVVGDGPERERSQALARQLGIAGRTAFVGATTDVPAMLAAMDVFVLSSDAVECLPMALLEAMASGLPAVCTDIGGLREMVEEGVTGHLVPVRRPDALAAAVRGIVTDPDRARVMGAAARARARAQFDRSVMVQATQDVLTDIAAGGPTTTPVPLTLTVVMDLTFVGGAERLLLSLCGAFDRSVIAPRIVCLREEGPLAADFRARGVPVDVLDGPSGRDPRRIGALATHLRRTGTDVVLVAHHHRAALAVGRLAAAVARIPSVVAAHDMDLTDVGGRVLPRWAVATLAASRALVLLSRAQGEYLHRAEGVGASPWSRTREVVIGNGIVLPPPPTRDRRVRARELLGLTDDDIAVGMVARLSAQKAHEVAFAAFAKMLADCPTAVLLLMGTGPRDQELRDLAADLGVAQRVRFLGVRDDVPDVLPGLDVSCLSSVHEGVPLVLAESMASAVPVVATGCGSVPDMITDGVEGFVVGVGDHDALADRLIALASDPDLRRRLGAAGRERARHAFDIADTARAYERLTAEVARGR